MPSRANSLSLKSKIRYLAGLKLNRIIMDKETVNTWIMYHEIQRLIRLGFSKNKIAYYLKLNWRTVNKYFNMSENDFEQFLLHKGNKDKILDPYRNFCTFPIKKISGYFSCPDIRLAQETSKSSSISIRKNCLQLCDGCSSKTQHSCH